MGVGVNVACGGQRTIVGHQFSPSIVQIPVGDWTQVFRLASTCLANLLVLTSRLLKNVTRKNKRRIRRKKEVTILEWKIFKGYITPEIIHVGLTCLKNYVSKCSEVTGNVDTGRSYP